MMMTVLTTMMNMITYDDEYEFDDDDDDDDDDTPFQVPLFNL